MTSILWSLLEIVEARIKASHCYHMFSRSEPLCAFPIILSLQEPFLSFVDQLLLQRSPEAELIRLRSRRFLRKLLGLRQPKAIAGPLPAAPLVPPLEECEGLVPRDDRLLSISNRRSPLHASVQHLCERHRS